LNGVGASPAELTPSLTSSISKRGDFSVQLELYNYAEEAS